MAGVQKKKDSIVCWQLLLIDVLLLIDSIILMFLQTVRLLVHLTQLQHLVRLLLLLQCKFYILRILISFPC
jgi:hypothetical protein